MACAWAGFAGYAVAMLLSYFVGQKKYPIAYDLKGIGKYVAATIALYLVSEGLPFENMWVLLAIRTGLLLVFVQHAKVIGSVTRISNFKSVFILHSFLSLDSKHLVDEKVR
jgi:hypothetical protein